MPSRFSTLFERPSRSGSVFVALAAIAPDGSEAISPTAAIAAVKCLIDMGECAPCVGDVFGVLWVRTDMALKRDAIFVSARQLSGLKISVPRNNPKPKVMWLTRLKKVIFDFVPNQPIPQAGSISSQAKTVVQAP